MTEKKRVLIICRSTAGQMYLGVLLKRIWFSPIVVRNAMEGIREALSGRVSVILFDVDMQIDEIQASLSLLRTDPTVKALPIIAVVNQGTALESEGFLAQGCSAVVIKPPDLALLYGLLNRLSGQPRATPRAPARIRVDVLEGGLDRALFSLNVSEGGLYLLTYAPLPEGTILHLRFTLPRDIAPIEATAKVVRAAPLGKDVEVEPGMALQFIQISDENRAKVRNFIQWEMMGDLEWEANF